MAIENVKCPACDGPMVSRANKTTGQRFWGCKRYPECKGTRDTDGEANRDRAATNYGNDLDDRSPSERQRANDRRRW